MNKIKLIIVFTLVVALPTWAGGYGSNDEYKLIQNNEGWVYVGRDNRLILKPYIFDNGPDYFEEGLARFIENGKMGFHDQALNIIIPAKYDFVYPFENGTAQAGTNCTTQQHGEHSSVSCEKWESIHNPASTFQGTSK